MHYSPNTSSMLSFATRTSLLNGFMTYSLAPAASARRTCSLSVSVVTITIRSASYVSLRTDGADEIEPVHLRHVPVHQHKLDVGVLAQLLEPLAAVASLDHIHSHFAQDIPDDDPNGSGVVDDQRTHLTFPAGGTTELEV